MEFLIAALPKLPGDENVNKPVVFQVSENRRFVVHTSAAAGPHQVSLPVEGANATGSPMSVHLNRDYVLKALKLGLAEIQLFSPLDPVVFSSGGTRLIVMGLRPDVSEQKDNSENSSPQQNPSSTEAEVNPKEDAQPMKTVNRIEQTPAAETAPRVEGNGESRGPSAFHQVQEQGRGGS